MVPEEGDEPVWWALDRGVSMTAWSGPQLDSMELVTTPVSGSDRCEGRVSVALDGTWRCSALCSGPPSNFHLRENTVDCSAGTALACCCWHCLEMRAGP